MDHSCSHRNPVLLGHVATQTDLVKGTQAADGHGQVDALAGDMFQSSDVWKIENQAYNFIQPLISENVKFDKFHFNYSKIVIAKCMYVKQIFLWHQSRFIMNKKIDNKSHHKFCLLISKQQRSQKGCYGAFAPPNLDRYALDKLEFWLSFNKILKFKGLLGKKNAQLYTQNLISGYAAASKNGLVQVQLKMSLSIEVCSQITFSVFK